MEATIGYFPNGTEGELYQEQWCDRCIHDREENCPVWAAHLLRNYEECNNDASILHMLIPRSKDGLSNEQCRMFIAVAEPAPICDCVFCDLGFEPTRCTDGWFHRLYGGRTVPCRKPPEPNRPDND